MRALTTEELVALATKVVQEHKAITEWRAAKQVMESYYGPQACSLQIDTTSEYNDESYDDVIDSVTVYDAKDDEIYINATGTHWQQQLKQWRENHPQDTRSDEEIFHDDLYDDEYASQYQGDLPIKDVTIRLDQVPTYTAPTVYVD